MSTWRVVVSRKAYPQYLTGPENPATTLVLGTVVADDYLGARAQAVKVFSSGALGSLGSPGPMNQGALAIYGTDVLLLCELSPKDLKQYFQDGV